jgi:hypothetical protein
MRPRFFLYGHAGPGAVVDAEDRQREHLGERRTHNHGRRTCRSARPPAHRVTGGHPQTHHSCGTRTHSRSLGSAVSRSTSVEPRLESSVVIPCPHSTSKVASRTLRAARVPFPSPHHTRAAASRGVISGLPSAPDFGCPCRHRPVSAIGGPPQQLRPQPISLRARRAVRTARGDRRPSARPSGDRRWCRS